MKKAFKKLNVEGFNDMHATEILAMHNLSRCQEELQNDVTNSDKQKA